MSLNPEGIVCFKRTFLHKIPSGLDKKLLIIFYKHKFPSGMEGN